MVKILKYLISVLLDIIVACLFVVIIYAFVSSFLKEPAVQITHNTSIVHTKESHNLQTTTMKRPFQYSKIIKQVKIIQKSNIQHANVIHIQYSRVATIIKQINPDISDNQAKLEAIAFVHASQTFNIPLEILLAIAHQESRFDVDAISTANCVGVMQINPAVWNVPSQCLYNPICNILVGSSILKYCYDKTGNWNDAFTCYYGYDSFGKNVYPKQVSEKVTKYKQLLHRITIKGGENEDTRFSYQMGS